MFSKNVEEIVGKLFGKIIREIIEKLFSENIEEIVDKFFTESAEEIVGKLFVNVKFVFRQFAKENLGNLLKIPRIPIKGILGNCYC